MIDAKMVSYNYLSWVTQNNKSIAFAKILSRSEMIEVSNRDIYGSSVIIKEGVKFNKLIYAKRLNRPEFELLINKDSKCHSIMGFAKPNEIMVDREGMFLLLGGDVVSTLFHDTTNYLTEIDVDEIIHSTTNRTPRKVKCLLEDFEISGELYYTIVSPY